MGGDARIRNYPSHTGLKHGITKVIADHFYHFPDFALSHAELASMYGFTKGQVKRAIKYLRSQGYIFQNRRHHEGKWHYVTVKCVGINKAHYFNYNIPEGA